MRRVSFNTDAELRAWLGEFVSQNRVISTNEVLKILLNIGKNLKTTMDNTLMINKLFLLNVLKI